MLTVYKYPVPIDDKFTLRLPRGARFLHFDNQCGQPMLWALVDPNAPLEPYGFRLAGTGHPIDEASVSLYYLGSAQFDEGRLISHLFEIVA